ncbi:MAG: TOBE domain-containing protein, partial [Granulosicoccaceae bacterium]
IVVLNAGNVEQVGAPMDLYHRPANTFVAGFIGSPAMNLIKCRVANVADGEVELHVGPSQLTGVAVAQSSMTAGEPVTLGVRPEHLSTTSTDGVALDGNLEAIERLGDITYLYLKLADQSSVTVAEQGDHSLEVGEKIRIYAKREQLHLFDANGQAIR